MQQTTKYKFNIIETSDTFGPEALNANTKAVETQLTALEAADAALSKADAANKTALEQSIASTKSALQAADAAIRADLGSVGKTARIVIGSYVGNGQGGPSYPTSITVDFKPMVLFISDNSGYQGQAMFRTCNQSITQYTSVSVVWGDRTVSWYSTGGYAGPGSQMNLANQTYNYLVIGTPD